MSRLNAAADSDLYSAAEVIVDPVSASVAASVRATAQDGIVYPAGSFAGVFFTAFSSCGNCAVTINTYLDGVLQESHSALSNTFVEGRGSPADLYSGIDTTLPFDAVEISDAGAVTPGGSDVVLQVFEICSNGGVRD